MLHKLIECLDICLGYINILGCGTCVNLHKYIEWRNMFLCYLNLLICGTYY